MAARSIASLTLSFGLVSIPVKLYSATESAGGAVKFNLLSKEGHRVKQQYVDEETGQVVPRSEMAKGYEFEKDRFVMFTSEELKALEESSSHMIEIVSFIPERSVDPTFYDKAYFLAPDKRGGKPYALLQKALQEAGRCALAKWAWKARQYVVQIRATDDGLILQQLLYAEEVRSMKDLAIPPEQVTQAELQLAMQLVDQNAVDEYDPAEYKDEERARVLAAIDEKIAGGKVVASSHPEDELAASGQVIDLMAALQASLGKGKAKPPKAAPAPKAAPPAPAPKVEAANVATLAEAKTRKGVKRVAAEAEPVAAPAPRARARK